MSDKEKIRKLRAEWLEESAFAGNTPKYHRAIGKVQAADEILAAIAEGECHSQEIETKQCEYRSEINCEKDESCDKCLHKTKGDEKK